MWCLKAKNSNSYCSLEGRYRRHKKSFLAAKKVRLGFRGFCTCFLLLTTPYVMFESKKSKFLLLIRRKIAKNYKPTWTCVGIKYFLLQKANQTNKYMKHQKIYGLTGLVQLVPRLYSGWGFLPSQWDRQLKFSAYASFLISLSLSKFELI